MRSDASATVSLAAKVEREQLRLAVEQHRRVALPHFLGSLAVAVLAWKVGVNVVFLLSWLALTGALQVTRYLYVGKLAPHLPELSVQVVSRGLDHLAWWIRCLGVINAAMILSVFLRPTSQEHFLVTMVLLGNATGTVSVVSGRARLYVQWSLIYGGALVLAWLQQGTWESFGVAFLIVLLFAMLAMHVQDQGRTLVELVSLSDSLRVERDRVESASASKTRFFAAASHDLRQPLTALSYHAATIQALAQRDDDPLLKQVGDGVSRALSESQSLLDSLLEVSKLDAGAVPVHREEADIGALACRVCEEAEPSACSRGLILTCVVHPAARGRAVYTDMALLRRILQNLVSNAVKFTEQGRVDVSVNIANHGTVDALAISVSDTGRGIPRDDHEKIFEEFFQLENAERDRTRGLGLGLAIVRRMLQLIGASIAVESEPGKGSTFTVSIPMASSAAPRVAASSTAASPNARLASSVGRYRALCLDDEPEVRTSLGLLLETLNWEVRAVGDTGEALRALAGGFKPDVLLVDFRLREGASGLDAIEALRAAHCAAPALLITGDTEPGRIALAQAAGIDILHKPVDGQRLLTCVHALVALGQPARIPP